MSEIQHTETPWRFHAQGDANHYCLLGPDNKWVIAFLQNGEMTTAKQLANAEFIVRACNVHDALVRALQASTHILHLMPDGPCKCSQCDFVRLRDVVLDKVPK